MTTLYYVSKFEKNQSIRNLLKSNLLTSNTIQCEGMFRSVFRLSWKFNNIKLRAFDAKPLLCKHRTVNNIYSIDVHCRDIEAVQSMCLYVCMHS